MKKFTGLFFSVILLVILGCSKSSLEKIDLESLKEKSMNKQEELKKIQEKIKKVKKKL